MAIDGIYEVVMSAGTARSPCPAGNGGDGQYSDNSGIAMLQEICEFTDVEYKFNQRYN